jgi:hypothetical protein
MRELFGKRSAATSGMGMLSNYGKIVGRKMAFVALGWILVYFISQPFRGDTSKEGINILMLFAPLIGAFAGVVAGWYLATDAVEDSNLSGMTLWFIIVIAAVAPMWIMEGILFLIFRWPMHFGGFMVLTSSTILALAAAVWHASSQE